MNKRTRLIVSLLFMALIILAVAITRFYLNVPKNPAVNGGSDNVEKIVETNHDGYSIFTDSSGNYGIAQTGRISAVAEWESLEFAGDYLCIAFKKIDDTLKYGCIDFDGNVVVPFIYNKIEKKSIGNRIFYCAKAESDDSFVIYNSDFVPCFNTTWKTCEFTDEELTLTDNYGSYSYIIGKDGLLFKSAKLSGTIMKSPYELNIYSRVLLSKLTPVMIEKMIDFTENYMEYAFGQKNGNFEISENAEKDFPLVFPHSSEINSKKIVAIPDVHIYTVGSENGVATYETSVSTKVEIAYTAKNGETERFTDTLKCAVKFKGNFETDLSAVSGYFVPETPDYPPIEKTVGDVAKPTEIIE